MQRHESSIYELAKAGNRQALEEKLVGRCVDEWLPGKWRFSAVSQLAAENDQAGVALLLSLGAHLDYVVIGAASGGHESYANELIAQGVSRDSAVYAAAWGGHERYANELIAQGASRDWAVRGAACGGHERYANELIPQGPGSHWAVSGAACGGHERYANELIAQGAGSHWAVSGAACGGHERYANELIAQGASRDLAVSGAACGGHERYANELIAQGASRDSAVHGAALGGHERYANELIAQGASRDWAVQGAASGGHGRYANELIAQGASRDWAVLGAACGGHISANHPAKQLRFLSSFDAKFIDGLSAAYAKLDLINVPAPIIRQAKDCSRLRQSGASFVAARVATMRDANEELLNRAAIMIAVSIFLDHPSQSPYMALFRFPSKDIWRVILNHAVGMSLSKTEWEALALIVAKTQVNTVLADYTRVFSKGKHKQRAASFQAAISETSTLSEFQALLTEQAGLLVDRTKAPGGPHQHQQPLKNKTVDGYHHLINRWVKRFLESPAKYENESQQLRHDEEFMGFHVMSVRES